MHTRFRVNRLSTKLPSIGQAAAILACLLLAPAATTQARTPAALEAAKPVAEKGGRQIDGTVVGTQRPYCRIENPSNPGHFNAVMCGTTHPTLGDVVCGDSPGSACTVGGISGDVVMRHRQLRAVPRSSVPTQ